MKRICFLAPDINTTHAIVEELRNEGIEDRYIHILVKRDPPLEEMNSGNSRLKKIESAIEQGQLLVLLDISIDRVGDITEKLLNTIPLLSLRV